MGTTRQHPPGDLGREPEGAGVGARSDAGTRADADTGVPSAAQAEPAGRQWRTLSLRDATGIVPTARDFARQALHDWGWLPASTADRRAAAEDVLLVVSELVTNACLHAEGPDEIRIARTPKALRVEVADGGAGQPAPRTPRRAGRPGGHGMFIVQRLCLDWGVVRVPGEPGKTVWAELAAPV
ncbi:ATP-binding protein [Streptomyces sp. OR43]|uniref:ATP-binding protein n=1 Tax=Streptomyces sp. or43 TaxID=2478957 RepID=UPI0011CE1930|nr:ATP-binding protein [Streptomyces sp. or43]TXS36217.1 ATP-binding protein [Streptomyces sp. or43]